MNRHGSALAFTLKENPKIAMLGQGLLQNHSPTKLIVADDPVEAANPPLTADLVPALEADDRTPLLGGRHAAREVGLAPCVELFIMKPPC